MFAVLLRVLELLSCCLPIRWNGPQQSTFAHALRQSEVFLHRCECKHRYCCLVPVRYLSTPTPPIVAKRYRKPGQNRFSRVRNALLSGVSWVHDLRLAYPSKLDQRRRDLGQRVEDSLFECSLFLCADSDVGLFGVCRNHAAHLHLLLGLSVFSRGGRVRHVMDVLEISQSKVQSSRFISEFERLKELNKGVVERLERKLTWIPSRQII
jgi:hypothetical protein